MCDSDRDRNQEVELELFGLHFSSVFKILQINISKRLNAWR